MPDSLLLQAFQGDNKTVPVWFMRQAGRYLPQYQSLKDKYSLDEMFRQPQIASQITCLPVDILKVDAAILFADILTLPSQMGFEISFKNGVGPCIGNPINSVSDVDRLHDFEDLSFIYETIQLVNDRLPGHIPLLGFAGAPFTVACYLIEAQGSLNFNKTLRFAYANPASFHRILKILTRNTIAYLNLQKKAGIKVFQLFDTFSGVLRPSDYAHLSLPYVQEIFDSVDLPSIYYLKNAGPLIKLMDQCRADFLSVCQSVVFGHETILEKNHKGIQGNLFNGLLYADYRTLEKEIADVLLGARHYRKFIFNLSHGVFPDTEVDKLKFVVEKVHGFAWKS